MVRVSGDADSVRICLACGSLDPDHATPGCQHTHALEFKDPPSSITNLLIALADYRALTKATLDTLERASVIEQRAGRARALGRLGGLGTVVQFARPVPSERVREPWSSGAPIVAPESIETETKTATPVVQLVLTPPPASPSPRRRKPR